LFIIETRVAHAHAAISKRGLLLKLNTVWQLLFQGMEVISLKSRQLPTHYSGDECG